MKKVLVICLTILLLTGCGAQQTFETVDDMLPVEPVASPRNFIVQMPEEAAAPTFEDQSGQMYLCGNYTICKQIFESGDLEKTVTAVSGKLPQELELLKTSQDQCDRYDFVWSAAGEDGVQMGKACILDDGDYHYVLSVMAQEQETPLLRDIYQEMFASCRLEESGSDLSTDP